MFRCRVAAQHLTLCTLTPLSCHDWLILQEIAEGARLHVSGPFVSRARAALRGPPGQSAHCICLRA